MEKKKKGASVPPLLPRQCRATVNPSASANEGNVSLHVFSGDVCVCFFFILSINSGVAVKSLVLSVHVPCVFL